MSAKRKFQVFVSSTYVDLVEERQTAVMAILKVGHIPAGMELFASGDKSQLEVIKRWIDESDVYLLILGTRYGSVDIDSGLSYTELEYDYAAAQGKPLFAVVMSDDAVDVKLKKSGSKYLEKDHPEKLKAFRTKVLNNVSSFFNDGKDIKSCVYESLIDISHDYDLMGWVRGSTANEDEVYRAKILELSETNQRLEAEVQSLRQKQTSDSGSTSDEEGFGQLSNFLEIQNVNIPANVATEGKDLTTTLHRLFSLNKGLYARSVTVGPLKSDRSDWYEKNVYAVFVTHRLMRMERNANGSRTYTLTERGLDFAIWLDMISVRPS